MITVAIIEDQKDVRDGLAYLIDGTDGFECIHLFRSMEEALRALPDAPPDVALVDIGLPGMSGIEGLSHIKRACPETQCLILTVYRDDDRIFEAMCAGACGYLLKKTPPSRLLESIREVAAGGAPMSPEIARRVVELFARFGPPASASYHLSPQETALLKLLVEGHHYKTAADAMGVSIHTVDFHIRKIYEKLHVHSKSEAVAKALRESLIR